MGKTLDQLDLETLLQLLRECQDDQESVALLQTYLDREHADTWQQQASAQGQQRTPGAPGNMSREEALQILGLSSDASEAEIIEPQTEDFAAAQPGEHHGLHHGPVPIGAQRLHQGIHLSRSQHLG